MAANGMLGDGCKVAFSISSPHSWTEVDQLADVSGPGMVADEVNNDVHGSAGFHRSFPGLKAVSPMVLTIVSDLDPASSSVQSSLWGLHQQGTTIWWRKEIPINRAQSSYVGYVFQGNVAGFEPGTPIADRQTIQVTIRFDGTGIGRDASAGASQI